MLAYLANDLSKATYSRKSSYRKSANTRLLLGVTACLVPLRANITNFSGRNALDNNNLTYSKKVWSSGKTLFSLENSIRKSNYLI